MNKSLKNIYICSSYNGCALNSYLLTKIYNFLRGNGYKIAENSKNSDVIIIGTCANDFRKEKEAINFIKSYIKKYFNKKQIIVTGCLPKINPIFFKEKNKLMAIGARQITEFNEIFNAKRPIENFEVAALNKNFCFDESYADNSYYEYYSPSNYYIEICQGCLNNCSYCAIKKAKGNLKSKPLNLILKEFRYGLKLGFKKFILLGDECGGYGVDLGTNFSELLRKLSKIKKDFEILIHNLEPSKLVNLYPFMKNILPNIKLASIVLPLQSGNPRILKLMSRYYHPKKIIEIVKDIKKHNKTEITTHFIYCFPSETRKEFLDSVKAGEVFDRVIFFLYSKKKQTSAAKLKQGISQKEKNYRTKCIEKLIAKNPKKYYFGTEKIPASVN